MDKKNELVDSQNNSATGVDLLAGTGMELSGMGGQQQQHRSATGIVCGRNNATPTGTALESIDNSMADQSHLFYLDNLMSNDGSYSNDTSLSTTAKLLVTSSALRSPVATHSPHRLTPLGTYGSLNNSPNVSCSPNSSTSGGSGTILPPVSSFMFPNNIRNDIDWWNKNGNVTATSPLMTAKLVSSTAALCDPEMDFYGLINPNEYPVTQQASTTAAL